MALQVAEGLANCYPRLAPTCEWDTAAAHVIVEEAGGSIVQAGLCDNKGNALEDWKTIVPQNKPILYNKEDVLNPYFVVYGKRDDPPPEPFAR
jgi:3'(2'), 5'-bisphosphate nucleotidase